MFGRRSPLERLREMAGEIDELLLAEIAERRRDPSGEDICSLLVAARFEDGTAMDDGEIRDQLMTLLIAGHETTATGLAWTLDLLARHPEAVARVREQATRTCARLSRSRCACAPSSRSPAAGSSPTSSSTASRSRPAPT